MVSPADAAVLVVVEVGAMDLSVVRAVVIVGNDDDVAE